MSSSASGPSPKAAHLDGPVGEIVSITHYRPTWTERIQIFLLGWEITVTTRTPYMVGVRSLKGDADVDDLRVQVKPLSEFRYVNVARKAPQ